MCAAHPPPGDLTFVWLLIVRKFRWSDCSTSPKYGFEDSIKSTKLSPPAKPLNALTLLMKGNTNFSRLISFHVDSPFPYHFQKLTHVLGERPKFHISWPFAFLAVIKFLSSFSSSTSFDAPFIATPRPNNHTSAATTSFLHSFTCATAFTSCFSASTSPLATPIFQNSSSFSPILHSTPLIMVSLFSASLKDFSIYCNYMRGHFKRC